MDLGHLENSPVASTHPDDAAEVDNLLASDSNVRNIGAGNTTGSVADKVVDTDGTEKTKEDAHGDSSTQAPLASISPSQMIDNQPQHSDPDTFDFKGQSQNEAKFSNPEVKDADDIQRTGPEELATNSSNVAESAIDSPSQHVGSMLSSHREVELEVSDENVIQSTPPADHRISSPARSTSPFIDHTYDSGVLDSSNPNNKFEPDLENYANEPTPKATEAPILDFPTTADIVGPSVAAPELSPQEPGSNTSSWNEDSSPNAPNAPSLEDLVLNSDAVIDSVPESSNNLPKAGTPINLDPLADFLSSDPTPPTTSVDSVSALSTALPPSSDPIPSSFQGQPPPEPEMLGDHKLPGMPSTSSLDVEPPTPTQHSDEEDMEQHMEPAEELSLRARGAQKVQDIVIPPAPDKPLPPTPGTEVKSLGTAIQPAAGKSCLSVGKITVMEILLWRDPKKSGVALAVGLVVLLSLLYYSCISVLAYLSLALLTVTLGFRLYKTIMSAVQKTGEGHPFQDLLSVDTTVSEEKSHEMASKAVSHLNCCSSTLKDLFLVKDIFESVKFGFALYLLTYVGACFNTMTLVIMAYVAAFTLPKVYEMNKEQIDQVLAQVKDKMADVSSKVKAAIPMGKKAEVTAEVTEDKKEE